MEEGVALNTEISPLHARQHSLLAQEHSTPIKLSQTIYLGPPPRKHEEVSIVMEALLLVFRAYRLDPAVREKLTSIRLKRKLSALLEETWDHPFWITTDSQGRTSITNEAISRGVGHKELIPRDEGENDDSEDDDEDYEDEDENKDEGHSHGEDENLQNNESEDSGEQEEGRRLCDGLQPKEKGEKHEDDNQAGTDTNEELVEILFGLSLALCTEHLTDSQPNSTVLVYSSDILGFSKTSDRFLPARSYTPYLFGLIYI